jgi:hypothetical protein
MLNTASFAQSPLLELRTEAGAVYLCPSRLQRMRLQWTFRHFHVLAPQVLSRHDQRLIEKLSQSAVVTPSLPVASEAILGVVEKASALTRAQAAVPVGDLAVRDHRAGRWVALGTLTAAAIGMIALLVWALPMARRAPEVSVARTDSAQAASAPLALETQAPAVSLLAAPPAELPAPLKLRRIARAREVPALAGETPAGTPTALAETAAATMRRVTELPARPFAHPMVAQHNLMGDVELKAMIAPDGSVSQVAVMSGDARLAEAGMRAVRQWHYSPYPAQGAAVEEETQIKMSFFGADAVSIASVAR